MSRDDWARLRGMDAASILDTIGARKAGEHWGCPRCGCLFEVWDDPAYGVSVRCTRERCILEDWAWPESVLATLTGRTIAEATTKLLDAHKRARTRKAA